jgi:hypothetical protein
MISMSGSEVLMTARSVLKREMRVAFSRRAQPVWFRVSKWVVLVGVGAIFWRKPYFWLWVFAAFVLGLTVHFFWRWKTKGWSEPWGGWDDVETAGPRSRAD